MKHLASIALACLLLPLSGCASQTATATFKGMTMPVLLGPVDRIGGGEPLPTIGREIEFFSGSAYDFESVSSSTSSNTIGNTTYSTTTTKYAAGKSGENQLQTKLRLEFDQNRNWDLRLTRVRAMTESSGILFAIAGSSYQTTSVNVRGDVVAVKGGK